jgi:hypothetical protein
MNASGRPVSAHGVVFPAKPSLDTTRYAGRPLVFS